MPSYSQEYDDEVQLGCEFLLPNRVLDVIFFREKQTQRERDESRGKKVVDDMAKKDDNNDQMNGSVSVCECRAVEISKFPFSI